METNAILSKNRKYRYALWRIWDKSKQYAMFVCLNPSTADETEDDPTIRRCIGFTQSWGYGGLCVANLFSFRSTDPSNLEKVKDPVGSENDKWLKKLSKDAGIVIVAWGTKEKLLNRNREVIKLLYKPHYLELTKNGHPKHPLYIKSSIKPKLYNAG